MFKGSLKNPRLDFEYDDKTYIVGYNKNHYLNIKRKKGDGGKKEFNEDVSCFVQVNKNDRNYFLVGSYYQERYEISIYEDDIFFENLAFRERFPMDKAFKLDKIRVSEDTFIVDQYKNGGRLYTIGDEKPTKFYERIYSDKKIKDFLCEKDANNMILVDDTQYIYYYGKNIMDKLTYGIDINTKKIVTPIWSSLKNKLIHIYTEDDVKILKEKMDKNIDDEYDHFDYSFMRENHTLEEITKYFEIDRFHRKLDNLFRKTEGIYIKTEKGKDINKEYIMKFVPNNKE